MKLFLTGLQIIFAFVALFMGNGVHLGFPVPVVLGIIFLLGLIAVLATYIPFYTPVRISVPSNRLLFQTRSQLTHSMDPLII
ncbi:MAG: hypothetical protein EOP04_32395 [Proteobacteria bacterium]|nr:MAG: hypothetical protein EOP04_32395 [Pseudomonadota bacterium]